MSVIISGITLRSCLSCGCIPKISVKEMPDSGGGFFEYTIEDRNCNIYIDHIGRLEDAITEWNIKNSFKLNLCKLCKKEPKVRLIEKHRGIYLNSIKCESCKVTITQWNKQDSRLELREKWNKLNS